MSQRVAVLSSVAVLTFSGGGGCGPTGQCEGYESLYVEEAQSCPRSADAVAQFSTVGTAWTSVGEPRTRAIEPLALCWYRIEEPRSSCRHLRSTAQVRASLRGRATSSGRPDWRLACDESGAVLWGVLHRRSDGGSWTGQCPARTEVDPSATFPIVPGALVGADFFPARRACDYPVRFECSGPGYRIGGL